jgi:hypothetical protein
LKYPMKYRSYSSERGMAVMVTGNDFFCLALPLVMVAVRVAATSL